MTELCIFYVKRERINQAYKDSHKEAENAPGLEEYNSRFERKKLIKDHSEIKKIEDKYPYEDYEYKYGYNDDNYD